MKQTNCNKCIHINICQFINNNNLSEKDWEFIHDNFIIKCNQFNNIKNDNIQGQLIKFALKSMNQEQIETIDKISNKLSYLISNTSHKTL